MRFYDVDSGKITVDNRNITDITRKSLRENYGMVLPGNMAAKRNNCR